MRMCGLAAVVFCGGAVCGAFAETVNVPSGQTVTRTVALTENLVKTGDGTYVLSTASGSFSGTIDIQGGVLEMANTDGIGSAESLTVANGAQFRISAVKDKLFPVTHFTIAGDGPDGKGAIYSTATERCICLMNGRLTLAADSTVTFSGYFQAVGRAYDSSSPSGAIWDFGGYDLTLVTPQGIELYTGMVFENPGNINLKGTMTLSRSSSIGGSAENSIVLSERGSKLQFYCFPEKFPWTIDLKEDGTVSAAGLDNPESQFLSLVGPVKLSPGKRLNLLAGGPTYRMYVGGTILGGGGGASILAEVGRFFVTNRVNDFEADLVAANQGKLIFASKETFPKKVDSMKNRCNWGARTSTIAFDMSPGGWSAEEVHEVMDSVHMDASNDDSGVYEGAPSVYVPAGVEFVDETDIAEGKTIRMCGDGTYVLKGRVPESVELRNDGGGRLIATPKNDGTAPVVTNYFTGTGEIVLKDAGTVTVDREKCEYLQMYSGVQDAIGRVAIEGGTRWLSIPLNKDGRAYYTHITPEAAGGKHRGGLSVLELRDGAYMNAIVEVGLLSGTQLDAFYVRGGRYVMPANNNTIYLGLASRGYWEISGGSACFSNRVFMSRNPMDTSSRNNISFGSTDAPATGFIVRGGECSFAKDAELTIGLNGNAFYYQDGGTFSIEQKGISVNAPLSWESPEHNWTGHVAAVAIDGGMMSAASEIVLGGRTNGTAYLNVNSGGVLSVPKIRCGLKPESGRKSYVGFNGGVFKANKSGDILSTGDYAPDSVTVYKDGLTVDTAGYDISVSVPLEGATGLGVTGLSIPDNMPTNGYLGPHMVFIKGGSGVGALAILDVNTTNNTLRGVRVVSPGFGYAHGDEITALAKDGSYVDGDPTRRFGEYACGVALGDQAGGGLVKRGAGSLTLKAAATYIGSTVVEEGTLVFGVANALSNPEIVCRGGIVATADGIAYQSGLEFDVSALTDEHTRYVIARNWTGGTGCVKNLADRFSAKVRGGNLTVSRDYGMTVVVR